MGDEAKEGGEEGAQKLLSKVRAHGRELLERLRQRRERLGESVREARLSSVPSERRIREGLAIAFEDMAASFSMGLAAGGLVSMFVFRSRPMRFFGAGLGAGCGAGSSWTSSRAAFKIATTSVGNKNESIDSSEEEERMMGRKNE